MKGPASQPWDLSWPGIAVAFTLLVLAMAFHPWGP